MIKIPKLQILSVLVVAAALMALMVVPVLAQIPVFSGFSGSVTIGTAAAPVGSQLRAYVDGALAELPPPAVDNVYTLTTAGFYEIVIQTDDTDQAVTFEVKAAGTTQWLAATPTPASPVTSYQPQVVNLVAFLGDVPDISVSPTLVAFGSVDVGTSDTETVTVSNVGNADLTITMAITGTNANQFSVTPTSRTISPAGSYGLVVTFSPTSTGAKSATLTITSNDPDEPTVNVALSGTGEGIGPPPESFRSWLYETFVECLLD